MKKGTLALIALMLTALLALAACGDKNAEASQPASQASQPAGEATIAGTVIDATMNTVTIQVPNGSEYTFPTEGADISSPEGLLIGDGVTIHYTGTFDEARQVQDVTVTSIFVDSEATGGAASQPAPQAPAGDAKSIEGTIEQYDGGDTMMIVDATGVDFLFSLEGADLHVGEEGFQVGDIVILYYYGELYDKPEVQDVTVGEVKKADQ